MSKLDRNRPYGEVFGTADGHRFEQDGKKFDASGEEILKTAEVVVVQAGKDDIEEVQDIPGTEVPAEAAEVPVNEPVTKPETTTETVKPAYTIRHKGAGKYAVLNGEEEIATGLTKSDAENKAAELNGLGA